MLIVFSGLPGTGKTTIARALAAKLGATWLRIDAIEQALRQHGGESADIGAAGYLVAFSVAASNLEIGRLVVADCVNPVGESREGWRTTARRAGSAILEIEIICSDTVEHRRRVERRVADIPGFVLPTWKSVTDHDYAAWSCDHLVIDTAFSAPDESVATIEAWLAERAAIAAVNGPKGADGAQSE